MSFSEWFLNIVQDSLPKPSRRRQRVVTGIQAAAAEVLEDRQLLTAQISIAPISAVTEGQNARFEITLSEASATAVSVQYSTVENTGPTGAVSGADYTPQLNQTVNFSPSETSKIISIATTDDSFSEDSEIFDVVLSNAVGAPISGSTATGTIRDNDGALQTVSISDATDVIEGQSASFAVTLSAAATSTVSVQFSTSSGSGPEGAASGSDFTAVTNSVVTFAPGQTERTITVATTDDQEVEGTEVFVATLSSPSGVTLADREASGRILDNDSSGGGQPTISISNAPAVVEGGNAVFTVTLSEASNSAVSVRYSTAVDSRPTAASAADFTARINQTLNFSPGQTVQTISIPTTDDVEVEDAETFSLLLDSPVNATLFTAAAIGTITDNEVPLPAFSVSNAQPTTEGNAAFFTVSLSAAATTTLIVDYSTGSASGPSAATSDVDFTAVTGQSLTFTPGQTQKTVSISTINDSLLEATETFQLNLSNPSNGSQIATAQGIGTINDNDGTLGFVLSKSAVTVDESGTSETFSIVLTSAPTSNVVFNVSSNDTGEATVGPATVTFTSTNWATAQTVTIAAVNDTIFDGNQTSTVTVSVNDAQSDNAFDSLADQTVSVTTVDDDSAADFAILGPLGTIADQLPTFSWTPIADAVSYDVELIQVGGANNPLIQQTVAGTSLNATSTLSIGRYRTWVRATLSNGTKTQWKSDVFQVNTPTTIDAIDFHGTVQTPTFTWAAVQGATEYRVFLSNRTTGGAAVFNDVVSGTSYTPASNLNFGRYLIWVRPIGLDGYEGAWSISEDYYVGPTLLAPVNPTLDSTPQFSWSSISGAATYHLFVTGPGGVLINEPSLTGTSYTPTTDLPTGDFRWWIKPSTASGQGGAWSPVERFSTGGRTTVVSHSGTTTESIPELSWGAVPGAQSYEIYVSKDGEPGALYRQAGLTGTSYPSQALADGDYKVWIRTTLANGSGIWGGGVAFTVASNAVNLQTTAISPVTSGFDTTPQFQWSATAGSASYDIYLHDGTNAILQSNLTGTAWSPSTPLATGDWTWSIRPRNSAGVAGAWSTPTGFSTSGRTVLLTPSGSTADRTPTFTWQPVSGAVRYIIQVDNLTTGASRVIREDNVTSTSLTSATTLSPGTYRVWVRAVSSAATSPWSVQVDFVVT